MRESETHKRAHKFKRKNKTKCLQKLKKPLKISHYLLDWSCGKLNVRGCEIFYNFFLYFT